MIAKPTWAGVFPAATTQFHDNGELDLPGTARVQQALIADGVHGMVVLGTVGENNSLEPHEKRQVLSLAVANAKGRVPIIVGVSELTTKRAEGFAADAQALGADGLMVLPAMVYVPSEAELIAHFAAVANASDLPIMLYNNPPAYRVSISLAALESLAALPTIVALKESAPDPRRFTDVINALGDRLILFAGLDDLALEGLILGAKGWVSGLTNAFPEESVALVAALAAGDVARARAIYRWFMPLLHLDADHDLVQAIKLSEAFMGRGSEMVRPPRHKLEGARRDDILARLALAKATRPVGPKG